MSELTAGRAVIELLKAEQVRYIFGIVGSTFLDVLDALYDDRSVEYINVRHEQAAAFMADGLARVTGHPGVCLVTSGPGATNLLTGVAAAYVAHSPVVVLVGGVPLEHYQKDAFQDYDLVSDVPAGDQARRPDHQARAHPRAAALGAARGHERPAGAGVRGDSARRPERTGAPDADSRARSLPGHAPAAAAPRRHPRGGAVAAGRRAAAPAGGRRRHARRGQRPRRASQRPVRDSHDHGVWPERRGAQRASAVRRPAGARGGAGGGRGLPARRRAPRRRLPARAVHEPLRPSGDPPRDAASSRSTSTAATSAATTRSPSASRRTRASPARLCWRPWRGAARARRRRRGGRRRRPCAPSARPGSRRRADSTRSR